MVCYCRVNFHSFGTSKLEVLTNEVRNGVYNNPTIFVSPPYTGLVFDAVVLNYFTAAAEYKQFGITKKTPYLAARKNLFTHLDGTAAYVDTIAVGDVSKIALAGFTPSKVQAEPAEPMVKIKAFSCKTTEVPGEIIIDIPSITGKGSVNYGVLCVEGAALKNPHLANGQIMLESEAPVIYQDFNKGRRKVFEKLSANTQYFIYVYASNSVSVSPLSDVRSIWVS